MKELFKKWWDGHGTKIIGFGSFTVGVITAIDQGTVHLIENMFGKLYANAILIVSGLATAWRGYINSTKTPPPPQ